VCLGWWLGKAFDSGSSTGYNLFNSTSGQIIRAKPFNLKTAPPLFGSKPSVHITYEQSTDQTRWFLDEVKQVRPPVGKQTAPAGGTSMAKWLHVVTGLAAAH
jgi:hypothetical protein